MGQPIPTLQPLFDRSVTYRYLRPKLYSQKRREIVTAPTGGICFRLEESESRDYVLLSYSMCHPADVFSKSVARTIAGARATAGMVHSIEPLDMNLPQICQDAILIADEYELRGFVDAGVRRVYIENDLRLLRERIFSILQRNAAAEALATMNHDVLTAMNLKDSYEACSR